MSPFPRLAGVLLDPSAPRTQAHPSPLQALCRTSSPHQTGLSWEQTLCLVADSLPAPSQSPALELLTEACKGKKLSGVPTGGHAAWPLGDPELSPLSWPPGQILSVPPWEPQAWGRGHL